jgi:hypothetical protein
MKVANVTGFTLLICVERNSEMYWGCIPFSRGACKCAFRRRNCSSSDLGNTLVEYCI